jgi:hypothetical protein
MIRTHNFAQENTGVDKMPMFRCVIYALHPLYVLDNYYYQSNLFSKNCIHLINSVFIRFIMTECYFYRNWNQNFKFYYANILYGLYLWLAKLTT